MREHYDFSKMKGRKNPYIKHLKQSITMRLDRDTVTYFKSMAEEIGLLKHPNPSLNPTRVTLAILPRAVGSRVNFYDVIDTREK